MFSDNLFNLNQLAIFFSSLLAKHSKPFRESLHRKILVSSANIINLATSDTVTMLLIYKIKRKGPSIEP